MDAIQLPFWIFGDHYQGDRSLRRGVIGIMELFCPPLFAVGMKSQGLPPPLLSSVVQA